MSTEFNPSDEHIKAIFSKLAYEESLEANFNWNNLGSDFSDIEKTFLADNYIVLDAANLGNGFKSCWVQDKFSGEVIYAISGTTPKVFDGTLLDIGDDVDIGTHGMAVDQFISAYNYYQEMTANYGDLVYKIKKESIKPADGVKYIKSEEGLVDIYYTFEKITNENVKGSSSYIDNLSFTGHSLGGHLAGLMSWFTGNKATIFNAPGYSNLSLDGACLDLSFYSETGKSTTLLSYLTAFTNLIGNSYDINNIIHYKNQVGWSWTANIGNNNWPEKGIHCLYEGLNPLTHHGIAGICDTFYIHSIIKDIINDDKVFFENADSISSKEAFEKVMLLCCIDTGEEFFNLDYSDSVAVQRVISFIKNWIDEKNQAGGNVFVDVNDIVGLNKVLDGTSSVIYTGGKNDTITTGNGDDLVLSGDYGNLNPDNYKKVINLGDGNNVYIGYNGSDIVTAGFSSNDGDPALINGNRIYLGAGSDKYTGGAGKDYVDGGSGSTKGLLGIIDAEFMKDKPTDVNIISLGGGADIYYGGDGVDVVHAGSGDDIIETGGGNDIIFGGSGINYIDPGEGINEIYCDPNGEDHIYISNSFGGVDTIYGGSLSTMISFADGFSRIEEVGRDLVFYGKYGNIVILKDVVPDIEREHVGNENVEGGGSGGSGGNGMPSIYDDSGNKYLVGKDGQYSTIKENPPVYPGQGGNDTGGEGPGTGGEGPGTGGGDEPGSGGGDEPEGPNEPPVSEESPIKELPRVPGFPPMYEIIGGDCTGVIIDDEGNIIARKGKDGKYQTTLPEYNKDNGGYGQCPIPGIKEKFKEAETITSPLVLDLDGDGVVETTNLGNGTHFDHDNNGFSEKTSWAGKDDGILVRDLNGNGEIDGGYELFGNNTLLSNGEKAANGFEALADLDSNSDGIFNADDQAWNEVKVWQDKNSNGKIDAGEILSLEEAGVGGINLGYENSNIIDENGNAHKQTGSFIDLDGNVKQINDVWFEVDGSNSKYELDIEIPDDIKALPNISGFGNVYSLHEAMALDESGELKNLVQQYMSSSSYSQRQELILNIIYRWAGVQNVDPGSRAVTQVYGNAIGDARKLEALEEFLGEDINDIYCKAA